LAGKYFRMLKAAMEEAERMKDEKIEEIIL